jgi:uncharacterized membrane protein YbhN (UPF0104 family)
MYLLGWLGSLFFVALIWKQASAVSVDWSTLFNVRWLPLVVSLVFVCTGAAIQSQLVFVTQSHIGYPLDRATAYRIWFFSQLTRYIPGSLWQLATRSVYYTRRGVPLSMAAASTLWELVATIGGSLLFCCFSFLLGIGDLGYLFSAAAILLTLASLTAYTSWPWRVLRAFRIKAAARMIDALGQSGKPTSRLIASLFIIGALFAVINGIGFYFLCDSFGLHVTLLQAVLSFNLGYSIGFLVIVAPTGLGVREVILTLLLAGTSSASELALFVLIARLWWTAAEGINLIIAIVSGLLVKTSHSSKSTQLNNIQ